MKKNLLLIFFCFFILSMNGQVSVSSNTLGTTETLSEGTAINGKPSFSINTTFSGEPLLIALYWDPCIASGAWVLLFNGQAAYYEDTDTSSPFDTDSGSWDSTDAVNDDPGSPLSLTGPGTLPVELAFLKGKVNEKKQVELHWQTLSETNNEGFEIQRKSLNGSWMKIGYVRGNGNSSETIDYTHLDENPLNGENYYRLKQMDFDGESTLTNVILVFLDKGGDINIFPNPVRQTLHISLEDATGVISVYNAVGKKVQQFNMTSPSHTLDVSDMPNGAYFMEWNMEGTKKAIQFNKIK